ncbi:MAG: DUF6783 domain-containing protein [Lachnospiraceae bacterium]
MLGRLKNEKNGKQQEKKQEGKEFEEGETKRVRTAKCAVKDQHLSRRIHSDDKACLINHFCNLSVSVCVRFCFHSVDAACCAVLIQIKSSTNCDVYLAESIF